MYHDLIISGSGGQGALFAGQALAYAAMDAGLQVTWMPSYGPEMRGGTAHCTVIVSDTPIGAPLVRNPQTVIALNRPSLDKYEPLTASSGLLIYNRSLAGREPTRPDIVIVGVPGSDLAREIGDERVLNMVMLGIFLRLKPFLPLEAVCQSLERHLGKRQRTLLTLNHAALRRGFNLPAVPVPL
ncbi:MAG: 2-oxoacid:acceptor oxidoreductase family protein [Roseiflexus sp.]|jgi:2-oxoglutarate ferredoxin oxidoreductase subunit gamma|nr:2-oxoacid:acceptor oxidoreductase family protein [Roseiflexus sp.]MBO9336105.1 2-oxoacid:acceptor oxidoreductase family protein [Roseiflexus sp.]MBO9340479.1 2-oxoacid:acceptor oxidoreductase family protein [Roseiflexus sp.]MBO9363702.1 2-oxoacid:acceptor oxidoreductase family protein [Roseiflexus sp.]MBO9380949.1 2-oxoacid:acceptor oxidoreductase family protein [Roseiflexus sp.]